jgi:hypothetical protein
MDHAHKSNLTSRAIESTPSNVPSYASLTIHRRRNKRRVRHGITIDTYMLNRIRRLPPIQNTNNPFTNQFFNGSIFP